MAAGASPLSNGKRSCKCSAKTLTQRRPPITRAISTWATAIASSPPRGTRTTAPSSNTRKPRKSSAARSARQPREVPAAVKKSTAITYCGRRPKVQSPLGPRRPVRSDKDHLLDARRQRLKKLVPQPLRAALSHPAHRHGSGPVSAFSRRRPRPAPRHRLPATTIGEESRSSPYDLPANKTPAASFETLGFPGGKGYNEFSHRRQDKAPNRSTSDAQRDCGRKHRTQTRKHPAPATRTALDDTRLKADADERVQG